MWFGKPPGREELGEGGLSIGMGCEGIGKTLQHVQGLPPLVGDPRQVYLPEGSRKGQTSFPR